MKVHKKASYMVEGSTVVHQGPLCMIEGKAFPWHAIAWYWHKVSCKYCLKKRLDG